MDKQKCGKCKHYFITWDQFRPYGCKAYGFKSKVAPIIVVKESSGEGCKLFEPKAEKGRGS